MTARLSIDFIAPPAKPALPAVILLDTPACESSPSAMMLDEALGGAITRAIAEAKFKARHGDSLVVRAGAGTVLLIGSAAKPDASPQPKLPDLGGAMFAALNAASLTSATLYIDDVDDMSSAAVAEIAYGAVLASYHFPHYFTKARDQDTASPDAKSPAKPKYHLAIACRDPKSAESAYTPHTHRIAGVFLARDLVSEPANVLYPEEYATRCQALTRVGIKLDILDEAAMEKQGMRLLLSVGQGSRRESRLVVMRWEGGDAKTPPLALIGKGVCFDTGGISLKPAGGMEDMKWDMGGSAAVVGAMRAIAGLKLKQNVVGLIGLVENMPDGQATRPGDVVKSMDGQTVEIINTDAEGRLVLADVITYAKRHFAPGALVDLATLTGAIIVALGHSNAGLFANNDALAQALTSAGDATGEPIWRMPLGDAYDKLLKSNIADMKNIGGRWAGAVTAACFVQRFAETDSSDSAGDSASDSAGDKSTSQTSPAKTPTKTPPKTPWAHIDIAGMAWADKASATAPSGGTGFGVRLLTQFVEDY